MDTLTKTCASCRTTRQSQKGIVQQKTTVAVLPNAARHRPSSSSSWKDIVLQRVAQEIVFLSFKVRPIRNGSLSLCKAASLWMLFRVSFFYFFINQTQTRPSGAAAAVPIPLMTDDRSWVWHANHLDTVWPSSAPLWRDKRTLCRSGATA